MNPTTFPNFSLLNPIGQNGDFAENKATDKSIVEKHGRQISVQSEPGKDSSFKVCLPMLNSPEFLAASEKSKIEILLVERR